MRKCFAEGEDKSEWKVGSQGWVATCSQRTRHALHDYHSMPSQHKQQYLATDDEDS